MESILKSVYRIRKPIFGIFIILVLASIIFIILLNFLIPSDSTKTGFWVTISGEVKTELDESSHYPDYVWAYYPYHNLRQLAKQGKTIDLANILWEDNKGTFSMTFWLPIEMNITLTPDATGCNHTYLHVSPIDNIKHVDLIFDNEKCYDEISIPGEKDEILEKAKGILGNAFRDSMSSNFSSDEIELINEDVNLGSAERSESNYENGYNESFIHAYNAYWLGYRAYYRIELFKLKKCLGKSLPLLEKKGSCIVFPNQEEIDLLDANNSYKGFENSWVLEEEIHDIDSIDEAKRNIISINEDRSRIDIKTRDCELAFKVIEKSYDNQRAICKIRNIAFILLKWTEALALICIGILIAHPFEKWLKK